MAFPTLTPLPTPPSRSDPPDTFIPRADAWNAAIPQFSEELEALAAALVIYGAAVNYAGTSTTSDTISTGSTTITVEPDLAFQVGQFVQQVSAASPSNYMFGQITAYDDGTGALTIDVTDVNGSGTFNAWRVSLAPLTNSLPVSGGTMEGPLLLVADPAAALAAATKQYVDAVASASQPRDTDLTAIAALSTTSFGRSLLTQLDAAAARATIVAAKSGANTDITSLSSPVLTTPMVNGATISTVAGGAPIGRLPRASVNFDGTGTVAIRDSHNVSSITDGGVGLYTVNFTTALPDANYGLSFWLRHAVVQASINGSSSCSAGTDNTKTTTACQVLTYYNNLGGQAAFDPAEVDLIFWR